MQNLLVLLAVAVLTASLSAAVVNVPCPSGLELGATAIRTLSGSDLHLMSGCTASDTDVAFVFTGPQQRLEIVSSSLSIINVSSTVQLSSSSINVSSTQFEQILLMTLNAVDSFDLRIQGGGCTIAQGGGPRGYAAVNLTGTSLSASSIVVSDLAIGVPTTLDSLVAFIVLQDSSLRQGTLFDISRIAMTAGGESVARVGFFEAYESLIESSTMRMTDVVLNLSMAKVDSVIKFVTAVTLYNTPVHNSEMTWLRGTIDLYQGGAPSYWIRTYLMDLRHDDDQHSRKWSNNTVTYRDMPLYLNPGMKIGELVYLRSTSYSDSLFLFDNCSVLFETHHDPNSLIQVFVVSEANAENLTFRMQRSSLTIRGAFAYYLMQRYVTTVTNLTLDIIDTDVTVVDSEGSTSTLIGAFSPTENIVVKSMFVNIVRSSLLLNATPSVTLMSMGSESYGTGVLSIVDSSITYRCLRVGSTRRLRFIDSYYEGNEMGSVEVLVQNSTYDIQAAALEGVYRRGFRGSLDNVNITFINTTGVVTGSVYLYREAYSSKLTGTAAENISVSVLGGNHQWLGGTVATLYNYGDDLKDTVICLENTTLVTSRSAYNLFLLGTFRLSQVTGLSTTVKHTTITTLDGYSTSRNPLAYFSSSSAINASISISSSNISTNSFLLEMSGSTSAFNASTFRLWDSTVSLSRSRSGAYGGLVRRNYARVGYGNTFEIQNVTIESRPVGTHSMSWVRLMYLGSEVGASITFKRNAVILEEVSTSRIIEGEQLMDTNVLIEENSVVVRTNGTGWLIPILVDEVVVRSRVSLVANEFAGELNGTFAAVYVREAQDSTFEVANHALVELQMTVTLALFVDSWTSGAIVSKSSNVSWVLRNNVVHGVIFMDLERGNFDGIHIRSVNNSLIYNGEETSISPKFVGVAESSFVNSTISIEKSKVTFRSVEGVCGVAALQNTTIRSSSFQLVGSDVAQHCGNAMVYDVLGNTSVINSTLQIESSSVKQSAETLSTVRVRLGAAIHTSAFLLSNVSISANATLDVPMAVGEADVIHADADVAIEDTAFEIVGAAISLAGLVSTNVVTLLANDSRIPSVSVRCSQSRIQQHAPQCTVVSSNATSAHVDLSTINSVLHRCGTSQLVSVAEGNSINSGNLTIRDLFMVTQPTPSTPRALLDWSPNQTIAMSNVTVVDDSDIRVSSLIRFKGDAWPVPHNGKLELNVVVLMGFAGVMLPPPERDNQPSVSALPTIAISCVTFDSHLVSRAYFPRDVQSAVSFSPLSWHEQLHHCPVSFTQSFSRTASESPSPTQSVHESPSLSNTLSSSQTVSLSDTQSAAISVSSTEASESRNISESMPSTASVSESDSRSIMKPVTACGPAFLQAVSSSDAPPVDGLPPAPPQDISSSSEVQLQALQDHGIWVFVVLGGSVNATLTAVAAKNAKLTCADVHSTDELAHATHCDQIRPLLTGAAPPHFVPYNATAIAVHLPAWGDGVQFDGEVSLPVRITEQGFACGGLQKEGLAAVIKVVAPISAELEFSAAVTSATAAVSAAGALASPAALIDAQSLAVFSLISCSGDASRYSMKRASILLAPFPLGAPPVGFVTANLTLLASLLALFGLLVLYRVWRYPDRGLFHACYVMRFPSLFFTLAMMLYQGTAVLSMRLLFDDLWSPSAVLGSLFGLTFPLLIHCIFVPRTKPRFQPGPRDLTFFRYEKEELTELWPDGAIAKLWARIAVPVGRWNPAMVRRQFGGPVQDVVSTWVLYASLPLAQAFVVAIVASVNASSKAACTAQYAAITTFFLVFSACVALLRPYRTTLFNVFGAASYLMLAIIVGNSGFMAVMPSWTFPRSVAPVLLFCKLLLSTTRTMYVVYIRVFERLYWKPFALKSVWNAMRDGDSQTAEMFELALPLQRKTDLLQIPEQQLNQPLSSSASSSSIAQDQPKRRQQSRNSSTAAGWTVTDLLQDAAFAVP